MKTFINMLRDESGASAAEYALILAIIGGAIAVARELAGRPEHGGRDLGYRVRVLTRAHAP